MKASATTANPGGHLKVALAGLKTGTYITAKPEISNKTQLRVDR